MISTHNYDNQFDPAMPVMVIALRSLHEESNIVELPALVDSGSDGTMVPLRVLEQLNARRAGQAIIRGITGGRRVINLYEVTIQVGNLALGKFQVVGDDVNDEIVLGRDVLNQLVVTLNGLAQVVEVAE